MVEKDELELKLSRLGDFRGAGDNFHALFYRSETGRQEFGFSFLLDDADATSTEGNKPSVMAESRNPDPGRLGGLEDRLPLLNLYRNVIDLQFDLVCHNAFKLE